MLVLLHLPEHWIHFHATVYDILFRKILLQEDIWHNRKRLRPLTLCPLTFCPENRDRR
jgi:hypothetical protein